MGLRTASVRRPLVMVMAPALTETSQSQNFKLPPSSPSSHVQPTSLNECNIYTTCEGGTCRKGDELRNIQESSKDLKNAFDNLNTLALASELLKDNDSFGNSGGITESSFNPSNPVNIMNNSPLHMGDHSDKMGLQKAGLDTVSSLLKDKNTSDVDQLFNNLGAILPSPDIGAGGDIGQNVDEIMQVIKSIEASSDRMDPAPSDLGGEADSMLPLSTTDLTGNLSSFEKELLYDVDMMSMSMSMEEQLIEGATNLKESQAKESIGDLEKRQVKLERKLDFLIRRLRKVQVKSMGQHVSSEIAGVFEHVHRTLRRTKDGVVPIVQSQPESLKQLEPSSIPVPCVIGENISPEKLKPITQSSAKNLIRKLEMSYILQANSAAKQKHSTKYFGSGSTEPSSTRSNTSGVTTLPPWSSQCKFELQKVSRMLHSELRLVQEQVDSEATVSSSGGESCDEFQSYSNPHQQYLSM